MVIQVLILVALLGLLLVEGVKLWRDRRDPVAEKEEFLADFVVGIADYEKLPSSLVSQAEDAWREIQDRKVRP